jgi:membrane associated rhomboid family serine protease
MSKCTGCGEELAPFETLCKYCYEERWAQHQWESGLNFIGTIAATKYLVAANLAIFFLMSIGEIAGYPGISELIYQWGGLRGVQVLHGQLWRLFTVGFLHASFAHVSGNMWYLWRFGSGVERLLGSRKFLNIYFVSMLAGSLTSASSHPHQLGVGASGAVMGIGGALLCYLRTLPEAKRFVRTNFT